MRYNEIISGKHEDNLLNESRSAPLYHEMDFKKAENVFSTDAMPAKWFHNIPGLGEVYGNSFSRNKSFSMGRPVKLVVNQSSLATRHKIIPLDGERIFRHTEHGKMSDSWAAIDRQSNAKIDSRFVLAEEFVIGDIKNLHKHLIEIQLSNTILLNSSEVMSLYELVKEYCARWSISLRISQSYKEKIKEIEQRRAEEDELIEAAPSENLRNMILYHGTIGTPNAKLIMKQGLKGQETQGLSLMSPVANRAYLSQDLRYAIIYAIGGDMLGHEMRIAKEDKDPYGYVFLVKGENIEDIQPDEDSVGEFLYNILRKSDLSHEERTIRDFLMLAVSPVQLKRIKEGEYAYFASGGKRALKSMPDWMKHYLIDNAKSHVAATGKLMPSEVWRIDRRKTINLKKDGSNFFEVAKKVWPK